MPSIKFETPKSFLSQLTAPTTSEYRVQDDDNAALKSISKSSKQVSKLMQVHQS